MSASPLMDWSPVSRPMRSGAVRWHQIVVLLIAQRLDRRGVEALSARGQREMHGELADHRLACPGRCAHQHAVPALQCLARPQLKIVERERQLLGEAGQFRRVSGGLVIDATAGTEWARPSAARSVRRLRSARPCRRAVLQRLAAGLAPVVECGRSGWRTRAAATAPMRQRQHRERVRTRGGEGGENEQPEDHSAPPRLQPLVAAASRRGSA